MSNIEQSSGQKEVPLGRYGYLNQNCWLVKALNYPPYERCRYCELHFCNCLFLHYQIISVALIAFFLLLSLWFEGEISIFGTIFVFTTIIIYGYYFNKSTERIIEANFAQMKSERALKVLNRNLEQRVKHRTEALKQAYKELQVLDKAKTEFISIASHQLRTPIGVIRGYLSMMIQGDFGLLPPTIKDVTNTAYQASLRLLKLSNDLLNVSKLESGEMPLTYKKVSISRLIHKIAKEMKIALEEKNLFLRVEIRGKLPLIEIDPDKIKQALSNIIDNAIKYTEQGGINVCIEPLQEKYILITIKDTGMGLDQADIDGLFSSFFRGRAGNSLYSAGSGLGLYIAHKFISQHNGRLWAESSGRGKGSSFFVELPCRKSGISEKKTTI